MGKVITPSLDPRDGGIQALSRILTDIIGETPIKTDLVMNWKYRFKALSWKYNLYIHGLEMMPRSISQKIALYGLLKLNPPKKIIYVSNFTKKEVEFRYPALREISSVVLHNPLLATFEPEAIKKERIILTVCRLVPRKNVHTACSAFRASLQKKGWRHVVIGGGPLLEDLRKEFLDTEFLGRVSEEVKNSYLSRSAIFLHPQIARHDDFEGFGIAPVEAIFQNSLPIFGEKCGLSEIFENFPQITTDGSFDDVCGKLIYMGGLYESGAGAKLVKEVKQVVSDTIMSSEYHKFVRDQICS